MKNQAHQKFKVPRSKQLKASLSKQLVFFVLGIFIIFISIFGFNNIQMKEMVSSYEDYASSQEMVAITKEIYMGSMRAFNSLQTSVLFYGEEAIPYKENYERESEAVQLQIEALKNMKDKLERIDPNLSIGLV